jgi:DNA-binding IclR family transcriptional regulator
MAGTDGQARDGEGSSLRKAAAILKALTAEVEMRLSEIAAAAGINKVSALRILRTLLDEGYVRRTPDGRRYRLGPEALGLGAAAISQDNLLDLARPTLMRLAAGTGDTALFNIRSGHDSLCVGRLSGSYPIQANYLRVGVRVPLGVSSAGVCMLGALSDVERAAVLDVVEPDLQSNFARISRIQIETDAAVAARQGYFMTVSRLAERMAGLAAPVVLPGGELIGALSVGALDDRILSRTELLSGMLIREAGLLQQAILTARYGAAPGR